MNLAGQKSDNVDELLQRLRRTKLNQKDGKMLSRLRLYSYFIKCVLLIFIIGKRGKEEDHRCVLYRKCGLLGCFISVFSDLVFISRRHVWQITASRVPVHR